MSKSADQVRKLKLKEKNDKRYTLIKLQVPGGILAGKWWGPKDARPILCLHGWMDNCGAFDRLIPLLPSEFSYLTFDLPGHGLSSKYGPGMIYSTYALVILIERIRREYNWQKVSLIGHSLTGVCGFSYASIFPDKIDMFVALDNFQFYIGDPIPFGKFNVDRLLAEDTRSLGPYESEPPAYNYDDLLEKIVAGSRFSVDRQNAKYLLARTVKKSSKFPEKYYFNFDGRLRGFEFPEKCEEEVLQYAEHIVCPVLFCHGIESYAVKLNEQGNELMANYFEKAKKTYEVFQGPGNHHFFLTHPEHYANRIGVFIRTHRKLKNKL